MIAQKRSVVACHFDLKCRLVLPVVRLRFDTKQGAAFFPIGLNLLPKIHHLQLAVCPLQIDTGHLATLHINLIECENVFVDPVVGFRVRLPGVEIYCKDFIPTCCAIDQGTRATRSSANTSECSSIDCAGLLVRTWSGHQCRFYVPGARAISSQRHSPVILSFSARSRNAVRRPSSTTGW